MSQPMDPMEVVLTMVRIREHTKEIVKLSYALVDEPGFKSDANLVEKHRIMVLAIHDFDHALTNKK